MDAPIPAFELDNREIAILLWVGGFLLWSLRSRDTREAALGLVRGFFPIIILMLLATAYTAVCVWLLYAIGVWSISNLKTTILWGVTFILLAMMEVVQSEKGEKAIQTLAKDALSGAAIVIFIGEFYVLPLLLELLLVPLIFVSSMLLAMAEYRKEYASLIAPLSTLVALFGLLFIAYSGYRIFADPSAFFTLETAREFALPIILSLMFLPFLYGLLVYTTYENASQRLDNAVPDEKLRRYAFWRGLFGFRLNLDFLKRYVRNLQLTPVNDRATIRRIIDDLRTLKRREANPPKVEWSEGWSPYKAREFLIDAALVPDDYHQSFDIWRAEAFRREPESGKRVGHFRYTIRGTEYAATLLELQFTMDLVDGEQPDTHAFWETARLLARRAIGDEAKSILQQIVNAEGRAEVNGVTISFSHEVWGKPPLQGGDLRISLRHCAHVEEPL
ncbi:hypothetical protein [Methyloligella solikamskensis]|uniref:Uncharacterized protein n=1 Tax=Methyloligella solikamskensis TaxID=1177756 RepID=A0ABW3J6T1_9HYPH